ncbi:beta-1,4-mannosyltransferase egh-like [Mercenaria mercenaria]|uniref:beta-1,4-mannosyltransferase egh-like n=1 Tax=Mercenaria mercenaria TaxID=6596 RepID=UPI00234F8339|nr:beta-1,4-mannosyltransferase egh-like [Mercenaria mercenaria]
MAEFRLETGFPFEKGHRRPTLSSKAKHACVILMLVAFVLGTILLNIYRWIPQAGICGQIIEFVSLIVGISPFFSVPVAIFNCIALILYNPFHQNAVSQPASVSIPFICFRIVTRGNIPGFVIKNAAYNRDLCLKFGLQRFVIEIVSDKAINCQEKDMIREIVVPKSYRTGNGSLYKARALNYCLEKHVNTYAGNDWIVHLDEETLLTEASLSGILHFTTEGSGDIGQGPINYASGQIIHNWVTTLADSMRLAIDYSLFRFQFAFLQRPVFGFKGSYIVIRNKVEMEVGLDNGPDGSIAEDCFFALKAWSSGYKFGFITGEMNEMSPFTLKDYILQRRRWFVGQVYCVLSKEIPVVNKLGISLSLLCCVLMPISLSNILFDIACPVQKPMLYCYLNGLIGGTFAFLYCFGTCISCAKRNWSGLRLIIVSICCIFIIPIAAAMESIAIYWGLFTIKSKEFFIVQKDFPNANERRGHVKVV